MSASMAEGTILGAYLLKGFPFLSIINLVKFHLMLFVKVPGISSFKYLKTGWLSEPFTFIFSVNGKVTPWFILHASK